MKLSFLVVWAIYELQFGSIGANDVAVARAAALADEASTTEIPLPNSALPLPISTHNAAADSNEAAVSTAVFPPNNFKNNTADVSADALTLSHSAVSAIAAPKSALSPPNSTAAASTAAFALLNSTVSALVIQAIENGYSRLQEHQECKSLLKKYLTPRVKDALKTKMTRRGATLFGVIRSGLANLDARIGVYAPDADSYATFAALLDPIIYEYHRRPPETRQPPVNYGEKQQTSLRPLDPDRKYILSTRIRFARSLADYPLNPLMNISHYWAIQRRVREAVESIEEAELRQFYHPLEEMLDDERDRLIYEHYLFEACDRHMKAADACNFWPVGRGISFNTAKTFLVWANEEDHVRLISMEPGGDVGRVFARLTRGTRLIEERLPFVRDARLGWLTFCPTNLGSTVRASVHIRLRHLAARKDFPDICQNLYLQVRGVYGENSQGENGVYDISNKMRWGISEFHAVKQMHDGVKELIRLERIAEKEATANDVVKHP